MGSETVAEIVATERCHSAPVVTALNRRLRHHLDSDSSEDNNPCNYTGTKIKIIHQVDAKNSHRFFIE